MAETAAEKADHRALCGEQAAADTRSKFGKMLRSMAHLEDKEIEIGIAGGDPNSVGHLDIPGMPPGQVINLGARC